MKIRILILLMTVIPMKAICESPDLAGLDALVSRASARLRAGVANVRSEVSSGQIQFSTP